MRSSVVAILTGALLATAPAEVSAQWIVRPFFGASLDPQHGFVDLEQTAGDSKLVLGGAAGCHPSAMGFEFELSSMPGFLEGSDGLVIGGNLLTIMGNVVWQLPKPRESGRFRVYVAGGAGVVRARLDDAIGAFSSTTLLAAGNAGGGVLIRVRPRLDVDVDARYFKTQYGDAGRAGFTESFVSFTRVTGGVRMRF